MLRRCPRLALRGSPLGPVSLNFLLGALGRPPRVTTNQGPGRVLGSQTQLLAHTTRANYLVPRYKHTRFPGRPQSPEKNKKSQLHGDRHLLPWGPLGEAVTRTRPGPGPDPGDAPAGPSLPLLSSTSAFAQRVLRPAPRGDRSSAPGWGPTYGGVWVQCGGRKAHTHTCACVHTCSQESQPFTAGPPSTPM